MPAPAATPIRLPADRSARLAHLVDGPPRPLIARTRHALPLAGTHVRAGFPSPADDYLDVPLDLNEHLIRHPAATFYVRARGVSMQGLGIDDGDLLVVDRALEAASGDVVIAEVDGGFTVKQLRIDRDTARAALHAAHPVFPPLPLFPQSECVIWGVVTAVIKKLR